MNLVTETNNLDDEYGDRDLPVGAANNLLPESSAISSEEESIQ